MIAANTALQTIAALSIFVENNMKIPFILMIKQGLLMAVVKWKPLVPL